MAESRTIYKVKRFLSTLVQFGNDISSETGDRVKELIFNLVVSINEFLSNLEQNLIGWILKLILSLLNDF